MSLQPTTPAVPTIPGTPAPGGNPLSPSTPTEFGNSLVIPTGPAPYLPNPLSTVPTPTASPATTTPRPQGPHGVLGWLENAGKDALNVLNAPLQDVQHIYRYFHDVWERHGVLAALGEMGLAAGVGVLTGGVGDIGLGLGAAAGILAAEGTSQVEANLTFRNSWRVTANGAVYRDPYTHQLVSPGRDLASVIGTLTGGSHQSRTISGLGDAVFDFSFDPLMQLGAVARGAKVGEYAAEGSRNMVAAQARGVLDKLGVKLSPGYGVYRQGMRQSAEMAKAAQSGGAELANVRGGIHLPADAGISYSVATHKPLVDAADFTAHAFLKAVYSSPAVLQQIGWMVGRHPGDVLKAFPALGDLGPRMAATKSVDDAVRVMASAINNSKFSFATRGIPSVSITRRVLGNPGLTRSAVASDLLQRAIGQPGATRELRATVDGKAFIGMPNTIPPRKSLFGLPTPGLGKLVNKMTSYTPFSLDSLAQTISAKMFNLHSQDASSVIYRILRFSMAPNDARDVAARFALADDLGEKVAIYKNALVSAVLASGVKESDPFLVRLNGELQSMLNGALGGAYGYDKEGNLVRNMDDAGNHVSSGLWSSQAADTLPIPDFKDWRNAVASSKGPWQRMIVTGDDWLYRHFISRWFKQLVLLSMGFATRVSAGELIPAMMRLSPSRLAGGIVGSRLASELNWGELLDDAQRQVRAGSNDPLVGLRVKVRNGQIGVVKSWTRTGNGGTAVVDHVGEESTHPFSSLVAYHRDVTPEAIQEVARDTGIKVTPEEVPHIRAAYGKAVWLLGKALVDQDYRDVVLMSLLKYDGHIVPQGLMAEHGYLPGGSHGGERIHDYMQDNLARLAKDHPGQVAPFSVNGETKWITFGKRYRPIDPEELQHPAYWHFDMSQAVKDNGARRIARAYVDALTNGETPEQAASAAYNVDRAWVEGADPQAVKMRADMAGHRWNADLFSTNRVKAFEGLFYGLRSGKFQSEFADRFANGELPTMDELATVPLDDRPRVKGREIQPIGGTEMPTTVDRMAAKAWRPIQHTINFFSRQPIFTAFTVDEYKPLKSWIDAGLLTKTEAHDIAIMRAMYRMLPTIHNTMLRSQLHLMTQNIAPFFFAQEQAYRRYIGAMFSSPRAAREATLMLHGWFSSGAIQTDAQGNQYLALPGTGDLGALTTAAAGLLGLNVVGGIPALFEGNTVSLKSLAPEASAPSFSPLIAVPLKELANLWHTADPYVSAALGNVSYNEPLHDELIPNATLRRAWEALDPSAQTQAFATSYMQTLQFAAHRALVLWDQAEKIDPNATNPEFPRAALKPEAQALMKQADHYLPLPGSDPQHQIAALQRAKNSTRILMLAKAAVGFLSPLAPTMQVGDFKLRKEVMSYVQQYGLTAGLQYFLYGVPGKPGTAHPDATPDTVFESASTAGTNVPATKAALTWLNKNWSWATAHPLAAAYLLPQAPGAFNNQAYQEEIQAHLRQKRTPQQFLDAIYQAEGNTDYQPSLRDYQKMKAQSYGDTYTTQTLNQEWAAYLQNLAYQNPVWYENQFSGKGYTQAITARNELVQGLADGTLPDSPQIQAVAQLEHSYRDYMMMASQAAAGGGSMTSGQLGVAWKDYVDQFVTANPWAYPVAYGVYRRLVADAPYG